MKKIFDIFIIGGGINGCGIARDAAGRGFSVCLAEMNDFASGTSSWSTKLIHGGLRYLENFEFRLVRESLIEREKLLNIAPHIINPMKFVLPNNTKIRNRWLIWLGLKIYDYLYLGNSLKKSKIVNLVNFHSKLKTEYDAGFEYSDCVVDDSRLVILNARDADLKGATMMNYSKVIAVRKVKNLWEVDIQKKENGKLNKYTILSKTIINSSGPWINNTFKNIFDKFQISKKTRLVKGSHILVPKIYCGDNAFIFQNIDKRVIFFIPYQNNYSLIGTTDIEFKGSPENAKITAQERTYLINLVSLYFNKTLSKKDIIWSYSGVRSLYNDESELAQKITRDYVIESQSKDNETLINIYGGKLTTYRKLSENVMQKIQDIFKTQKKSWTSNSYLPGGNFEFKQKENKLKILSKKYSFLTSRIIDRMFSAYGNEIEKIFKGIKSKEDLGKDFGHGLFENEVKWLIHNEWATNSEDILWRRSKLGLKFSENQKLILEKWINNYSFNLK